MVVLLAVSLFFSMLYTITMLLLRKGWTSQPDSGGRNRIGPSPFISVIVPFKNEVNLLPSLIKDLKQQTYPCHLYEVILINDHSSDNATKQLISDQNYQIIISKGHGKKAALKSGIEIAKGDFIVTTDADCMVPKNWLSSISQWLRNSQASMLIGPVTVKSNGILLQDFQSLDYYALQISGAAAANLGHPLYCSGANLVFSKNEWLNISHQQAGQHLDSGDDVFLLHSFKKAGRKIEFLKNYQALVTALPVSSWKQLVRQRMRWGGKSTAYRDLETILMAILVFFTNFWLVVLLLLWPFYSPAGIVLAISAMMKISGDLLLLAVAPAFFNVKLIWGRLLFFSLLYPFWNTAIALSGILCREKWK